VTSDRGRRALLAMVLVVAAAAGGCMPPSWGANAMLHPGRTVAKRRPAGKLEELQFRGEDVTLKGWRLAAAGPRRGTVIYLHGVSSNRGAAVGVADHLSRRGFDVVAYDSRAHGESTGEACTYGYWERRDLRRVLDTLPAGRFVLLGSSMGAAVALQAAAEDERIVAVVAVATISDLRTAAFERAPFIASKDNVEKALALAEAGGRFKVDEVSPVAAAARIRCPVMVIHGAADGETPPDHSRRVFQALQGSNNRLVIVDKAGHNDALTAETWKQIDGWMDGIVPAGPR
jgi:pimeloyl-ACP methyl ester carboxylesterase